MSLESDIICSYCALPVLTGGESPEHAFPAAINGRFSTRTVCNECNTWAGKTIDQPWLDDPLVGSTRFTHQIPDRRGRILSADPLLRGVTSDGTQVAIGRDGVPHALNSPVIRDDITGEVHIHAKDTDDLARLTEKERRKAEAAGKTFTPGHIEHVSHHPAVEVSNSISPGQWQRMAAKIVLALLADARPPSWRTSPTADLLRTQMRDMTLTVDDVQLLPPPDALALLAPEPCSAVVIHSSTPGHALVSLLGRVAIALPMAKTSAGLDLAWVSDPLLPAASASGSLMETLAHRIGEDRPEDDPSD